MAETWRIARSSRVCTVTGRPIEPGTPFFSTLIENDDSFERRDFSEEAWPGVDKSGFFSYWRSKGTESGSGKRQKIDYDRLLAFFDGLEEAEEAPKRLFRYVLALILVRRRRLRLDDMGGTDGRDRLVVYDRRTERSLEIVAPEATPEDLRQAQEKLNELFECDFDAEP